MVPPLPALPNTRPRPGCWAGRAPALVWCPGGEYVAAIHAAPPPAHITYQHTTAIPHTHQLDTPCRPDHSVDCLIFARQGGCSRCPCDSILLYLLARHGCPDQFESIYRRYPFEDIRAQVSFKFKREYKPKMKDKSL